MNSDLHAFLYFDQEGDCYRVGRSLRSLTAAGTTPAELQIPSAATLLEIFRVGGPVLFLRAGAWLVNPRHFRVPYPSATGQPLCALGVTRMPRESDSATEQSSAAWKSLLGKTG